MEVQYSTLAMTLSSPGFTEGNEAEITTVQ